MGRFAMTNQRATISELMAIFGMDFFMDNGLDFLCNKGKVFGQGIGIPFVHMNDDDYKCKVTEK